MRAPGGSGLGAGASPRLYACSCSTVVCSPWLHAEVGVTTEMELAMAIQDKERYIRLDSHIGLTGAFKSAQV